MHIYTRTVLDMTLYSQICNYICMQHHTRQMMNGTCKEYITISNSILIMPAPLSDVQRVPSGGKLDDQ